MMVNVLLGLAIFFTIVFIAAVVITYRAWDGTEEMVAYVAITFLILGAVVGFWLGWAYQFDEAAKYAAHIREMQVERVPSK